MPGDETETVLEGLSPETLYQVSVIAAYEQRDSEPLIGQETTDGKNTENADSFPGFKTHSCTTIFLMKVACNGVGGQPSGQYLLLIMSK